MIYPNNQLYYMTLNDADPTPPFVDNPPSSEVVVAVAAMAALSNNQSPNYYQCYLQSNSNKLSPHSSTAPYSTENASQFCHYQPNLMQYAQLQLDQSSNSDQLAINQSVDQKDSNKMGQHLQSNLFEHMETIENRDKKSNSFASIFFDLTEDGSKSSCDAVEGKLGSLCLICEDKATGKHYGAYSCDGCKGFFRRSVRRNHSYACRQKRCCIVTKDKRNQCRFCRLRKCFRVGMKKSAVQNERDKISTRHKLLDTNVLGQSMLNVHQLLQAENTANLIFHHTCGNQNALYFDSNNTDLSKSNMTFHYQQQQQQQQQQNSHHQQLQLNKNTTNEANMFDICDSIRSQIIYLIEWANNLSVFTSLPVNDRFVLLKSHAVDLLILSIVWRSINAFNQPHTNLMTINDELKLSTLANQTSSTSSTNIYYSEPILTNPITTNTTNNRSITIDLSQSNSNTTWTSSATSTTTTTTTTTNYSNSSSSTTDTELYNKIKNSALIDNMEPLFVLTGNSRILSRHNSQGEIAKLALLMYDQLYYPMLDLCLEDLELACFKAVIFFDPNCPTLSENGRNVIRTVQYQMQLELMQLMNDKLYLPQGRFGALLLLLCDLRLISNKIIHKLQISCQFGLTHLDGLVSDLLHKNRVTKSLNNLINLDEAKTLENLKLSPQSTATQNTSPNSNLSKCTQNLCMTLFDMTNPQSTSSISTNLSKMSSQSNLKKIKTKQNNSTAECSQQTNNYPINNQLCEYLHQTQHKLNNPHLYPLSTEILSSSIENMAALNLKNLQTSHIDSIDFQSVLDRSHDIVPNTNTYVINQTSVDHNDNNYIIINDNNNSNFQTSKSTTVTNLMEDYRQILHSSSMPHHHHYHHDNNGEYQQHPYITLIGDDQIQRKAVLNNNLTFPTTIDFNSCDLKSSMNIDSLHQHSVINIDKSPVLQDTDQNEHDCKLEVNQHAMSYFPIHYMYNQQQEQQQQHTEHQYEQDSQHSDLICLNPTIEQNISTNLSNGYVVLDQTNLKRNNNSNMECSIYAEMTDNDGSVNSYSNHVLQNSDNSDLQERQSQNSLPLIYSPSDHFVLLDSQKNVTCELDST